MEASFSLLHSAWTVARFVLLRKIFFTRSINEEDERKIKSDDVRTTNGMSDGNETMVQSAFCTGNVEAKIGALLAVTTISMCCVIVVWCYAVCYMRRRRVICQQRLNEATEREIVAFQDVNLVLTFVAYLQNRGVNLQAPVDVLPSSDHRRLVSDPKLDVARKQVLHRILVFFGYEPEDPPSSPTSSIGGKGGAKKGAAATSNRKKKTIVPKIPTTMKKV